MERTTALQPTVVLPTEAAGRPRRRRRPFVLAALAAVIAVAVVALAILLPHPERAAGPEPSYPAVPGRLGEHLRQLERDVSPQHVP